MEISGARRFGGLGIAASGLSAQRARIETIAMNIANAETTRTADGAPYRRRVVRLEESPFSAAVAAAAGTSGQPAPGVIPEVVVPRVPVVGPRGVEGAGDGGGAMVAGPGSGGGVQVAAVEADASEGPLVYDPGHPDADESGYVRMPNVEITREMTELLEARRLYEANASVFEAVKSMLSRAARI